MGRDANVAAGAQKLIEQQNVVLSNDLPVRIGQFARLDVDPLDDANVGLHPDQTPNVRAAPPHHGLDDHTHVVEILP